MLIRSLIILFVFIQSAYFEDSFNLTSNDIDENTTPSTTTIESNNIATLVPNNVTTLMPNNITIHKIISNDKKSKTKNSKKESALKGEVNSDFTSNTDEDTYKLANDLLNKKVRIFCIIVTTPKYKQSRVIPQINTWVKRCSGYAYASSVNDDSINAIKGFGKDNYKYGYGKVRGALIKMWKKHGDKFDYYLKADDDSYVIMENLRLFLLNKDPNQDLYEGFKLHVTTDGKKPYSYHQGGAGYVMSKSVVKRLVETGFPKICQQNAAGFDDRVIGKCLTKLKVGIPDTRDMYNRLLFMPSTPNDFATKANNTKFNFFYDTNWNKFKKGSEGMSQYPLSFHYCDGNLMYAIEYLLYSANVIGIQQRIFHQSNNKIENKANVLKKMEQFSRVYYNKK